MNIKQKSLYTTVASIISLSLLMSSQVNAAAENAGEFYLGAKTGWSNFDFDQTSNSNTDNDAWAGSVYGGYQFNDWFSLEGGYNYLGNSKEHTAGQQVKTQLQNGELSTKLDWNLGSNWNLFGKVGGSYNYVDQKEGDYNGSEENWSLMLGAGVEYQINHNWRLRTEYQWFNNVGEYRTTGNADVNYLSVGISYYFGSAAPAAVATTAAVVAEPAPVAEPLPAVTLSKGAFANDSAELTPDAKTTLDEAAKNLNENPETNADVIGYTDSTGSAEYNQKLSEKRAQSASEYLKTQGVEESRVNTVGKGEANPIADNSTAEGREQNRRVEVYYK